MPAPKDIEIILTELSRKINEDSRRLRVLEERALAIEGRMSTLEDTVLRNTQSLREDLDKIQNRFKEFEERTLRIENNITMIQKELEKTAKKMEVKELENLISLYNPIKSMFITRDEVQKMLEERG